MNGAWYVIDSSCFLTRCDDDADAQQFAREEDANWPHRAPHRGVHIAEAKEVEALRRQRDQLLTAAQSTLTANLHLADGDNCTLIDLKRAVERITGAPI